MTEEERRRCILLGACNPDVLSAAIIRTGGVAHDVQAAGAGATLAGMLVAEGVSEAPGLTEACTRVLRRLGLPILPIAPR